MKQFICRIWKYNSDSYCSLSRAREQETLEEFKIRMSNTYPISEGWHLEYSEWNTITI